MGDINRRTACLWTIALPFIAACRSSEIPSSDQPKDKIETIEDHLLNTTYRCGLFLETSTEWYNDTTKKEIYEKPLQEWVSPIGSLTSTVVYSEDTKSILLMPYHLIVDVAKKDDRRIDHDSRLNLMRVRTFTGNRKVYIVKEYNQDGLASEIWYGRIIMEDDSKDIMLVETNTVLEACSDWNFNPDLKPGLEAVVAGCPSLGKPIVIKGKIERPVFRPSPRDEESSILYAIDANEKVVDGFSGGIVHVTGNAIGMIIMREPVAPNKGGILRGDIIEKSLRDHGYGYVADAMVSKN